MAVKYEGISFMEQAPMARLFGQYLAFFSNKYLPNIKHFCPK